MPELAQRTPQEILLDFVRTKEIVSVSFYTFALGISLALGALHALTPGHGKTVVAAYLVGSRGTAWHAVVLGSVVTLTHTGSVFLLGIITLAASQYILPTRIIPALEILSGVMIIFLGGALLIPRLRNWQVNRQRENLRPSPAEIEMEDGKKRLVINQTIEENEPSHKHDGAIPRMPHDRGSAGGVELAFAHHPRHQRRTCALSRCDCHFTGCDCHQPNLFGTGVNYFVQHRAGGDFDRHRAVDGQRRHGCLPA